MKTNHTIKCGYCLAVEVGECIDKTCKETGPHPEDVLCSSCENEEGERQKLHNLMSAVKNILLNMCDREEVYDDNGKPYSEFASLYIAYTAMDGTLGLFDEQELAEDCQNLDTEPVAKAFGD